MAHQRFKLIAYSAIKGNFVQQEKPVFNVNQLEKDPTHQKAVLWILRILVQGSNYRAFSSREVIHNSELLRFIGLEKLNVSDTSRIETFAALNKRHAEVEAQTIKTGLLELNLSKTAKLLDLNEVELELLGFLTLAKHYREISDVMYLFEHRSYQSLDRYRLLISVALQLPLQKIIDAMGPNSVLIRCRIVEVDHRSGTLELTHGIHSVLLSEAQGAQSLLKQFTQPGQAAGLVPADFNHIEQSYEPLKKYIKASVRTAASGVNVLLYGAPGTGKTELVRTLIEELELELFEVKSADKLGDPLRAHERFSACLISQQILKSSPKSVMLFDEIEDVFSNGIHFNQKAWINNMLEHNPRPTFWVSNDIESMDKAFLRRFDMIIRMPDINEKTRLSMMRKALQGMAVRDCWVETMAKNEGLQPAHLTRAVKVVRKMRLRKREHIEESLDQLLGDLYRAMGMQWQSYSFPVLNENVLVQAEFQPEFSNTDFPLEELIEGLQRSGEARLCLYGPPGTGKSAFGGYVSKQLQKPLLMKKASDLLAPYIGQTEKGIAAAFKEAKKDGAILMIDEADSFLTSRSKAQRSWEVSQVNEMLVQMENFKGILIMSTNFMDGLDSAALRRFDVKINFDYLSAKTALEFFNSLLSKHSSDSAKQASEEVALRLSRLEQITPGDFATVQRRARIMGQTITADTLIVGLEQEHAIKTRGQSRSIGFVH